MLQMAKSSSCNAATIANWKRQIHANSGPVLQALTAGVL
jgi:hypothetical protein